MKKKNERTQMMDVWWAKHKDKNLKEEMKFLLHKITKIYLIDELIVQ